MTATLRLIGRKTTTALLFFLTFTFSHMESPGDSWARRTREVPSEEKTDDAKSPTASFANKDITADEAYRILVSGNAGYVKAGTNAVKDVKRPPADGNQYPIATIVYSPDMKTSPAVLTGTTEHNVYLSKTKYGAVATDDLASVEYGLMNLQTPLLVVMSHYPSKNVEEIVEKYDKLKAGAQKEVDKAVKAKFGGSKKRTSELAREYNLIGPAIARVKKAYPDYDGKKLSRVVSETLAWQSLETILMKSTVARDLVRSGRLLAVAAIADDAGGQIYWLGEHPLQEEFLKESPNKPLAPEKTEKTRKTATKKTGKTTDVSKLTKPISRETVKRNLTRNRQNSYCNKVVYQYYNKPNYYVPSWRIFEPSAWVYCPWSGVCVRTFVPWPYWNPWGYPNGVGGINFVYTTGGAVIFIGYNGYTGPYVPWNVHFRPVVTWWRTGCFLHCTHWTIPVYNSIYIGTRIVYVPYVARPWWDPCDPGDPWDPDWGWDKPVGPVYPDPEEKEEWDITRPTDPIYPDPEGEEEEWDITRPVGPIYPGADDEEEEWDITRPVGPLTPEPEEEDWNQDEPVGPVYPGAGGGNWDMEEPVGPIYPDAGGSDWEIPDVGGDFGGDLGDFGGDW